MQGSGTSLGGGWVEWGGLKGWREIMRDNHKQDMARTLCPKTSRRLAIAAAGTSCSQLSALPGIPARRHRARSETWLGQCRSLISPRRTPTIQTARTRVAAMLLVALTPHLAHVLKVTASRFSRVLKEALSLSSCELFVCNRIVSGLPFLENSTKRLSRIISFRWIAFSKC